jgi:hypothetical protein
MSGIAGSKIGRVASVRAQLRGIFKGILGRHDKIAWNDPRIGRLNEIRSGMGAGTALA